mmetsp:Transcript_8580/g.21936  ORF Transcript_8580/g.21936 Transcript_8580/m.21936 type:complete len:218 (+) Transcript_8580:79-732(+)
MDVVASAGDGVGVALGSLGAAGAVAVSERARRHGLLDQTSVDVRFAWGVEILQAQPQLLAENWSPRLLVRPVVEVSRPFQFRLQAPLLCKLLESHLPKLLRRIGLLLPFRQSVLHRLLVLALLRLTLLHNIRQPVIHKRRLPNFLFSFCLHHHLSRVNVHQLHVCLLNILLVILSTLVFCLMLLLLMRLLLLWPTVLHSCHTETRATAASRHTLGRG